MTPHDAYPLVAPLIRYIANRRCRCRPELLEDVVQEAALLFVRKFDRFDGNPHHLPTFAGWMVGHAIKRVRRPFDPTPEADCDRPLCSASFDPPCPAEQAEEIAEREHTLAAVRRAVAELPDHWREVIVRGFALDGRRRETGQQIAARRGVTHQAVTSQRAYALRRLRKVVQTA